MELVAVCTFNFRDKEEFKYKIGKNIKLATLKPNDIVYATCHKKGTKENEIVSCRPVVLKDIIPYENINEITREIKRKAPVGKKVQLKDMLCNEIVDEITTT